MNLGMILFVCIGLYGFYIIARPEIIALKYKHDKGTQFDKEMSSEELLIFLTEHMQYPDTKEMHINEHGNIVIVSKYGEHELTIVDGKLFVGRGNGKVYTNIEEAECIKTYISHALNPSSPSEIPYEKYKKLTNGVRRGRKLKIISALISLGIIAAIIVKFYNIGAIDSFKSKGVSEMYYTDYSDTITIGEALKAGCKDGKWSNEESEGFVYSTFTGTGADGKVLTMVFKKDGNTCDIVSIRLGYDDYTLYESVVLGQLYANALGTTYTEPEPIVDEVGDSESTSDTPEDEEDTYNVENYSSIGDYTSDVMAGAVEYAESEALDDTEVVDDTDVSDSPYVDENIPIVGHYLWESDNGIDSRELYISLNSDGTLTIDISSYTNGQYIDGTTDDCGVLTGGSEAISGDEFNNVFFSLTTPDTLNIKVAPIDDGTCYNLTPEDFYRVSY